MSLARNSVYNFAGTFIPAIIGLLLVPIYIRTIGAERYGALALAWLLLGYFGQADFGIGRAITQRISSGKFSPTLRAKVVWSGALVVCATGIVGGVLIFTGGYWFFSYAFKVDEGIRVELLNALWMLALSNPVVALIGTACGSLRGIERFNLIAISNLVSMSAIQILPLLAVKFLGLDMAHLIGASLVARCLSLLMVGAGTWWSLLRGQPIRVSGEDIVALAHYGKWVLVSSLVGPLMLYADRFAIGAVLGAVAAAAYTVSYQLSSRTLLLPAAIVETMFPRLARATSTESRGLCVQYSFLIGLLFAPVIIVLICLWEPVLHLWLGRFLDPRSVLIGQILLAGLWSNAIASVPFAFLQARGATRFTATLHVLELPLYTGLLAFLAWHFGLVGVAATFSLRCVVDAIALYWRSRVPLKRLALGIGIHVALICIALSLHPFLNSWLNGIAVGIALATMSVLGGFFVLPMKHRRALAGSLPGPLRPIGRAVFARMKRNKAGR